MRNTPNVKAERYRVRGGDFQSTQHDGNNGAFRIGCLRIIAADGLGWDHVSVSIQGRCPSWDEMCVVRELFFHDDETVMQLHPAKADRINDHNYCLHLWRPQNAEIPMPPIECV